MRSAALLAVLVVVAVALALGLGEAAFRIAERRSCRTWMGGFTVRSRLWGWMHRPGADGWAQGCLHGEPEWRTRIRINPRGLRERDIPYARGEAFRILVLGDSFTAGFQVDQAATFAYLLERRLGPGVEVLNAGVSGWGTDNALLFFRHEGAKYRPDLVLLAFDTVNDVYENARALVATDPFWPDKPYFARHDGRLTLEHFPLPEASLRFRLVERFVSPFGGRSALFRRAMDVPWLLGLFIIPPPPPPPGARADPMDVYRMRDSAPWSEAWWITRRLVARLRHEVERRGARFVVTVINGREVVSPERWKWAVAVRPGLRGVALDPEKPDRLIRRFLARRRIATIPLLEDFRTRFGRDATPGYFQWDMHWAPAGHELAARVLADGLHRLGLVPPEARALGVPQRAAGGGAP